MELTYSILGSEPQGGGGGGGGILYFHTYVGSGLRFSQKMNIFLGMKILWIFWGGHHKIGLYLGVISMHFRVFS